MSKRVADLYECWWSFNRPRSARMWKMVPKCLFWCLSKEMNDRNFKDRSYQQKKKKNLRTGRRLRGILFLCSLKLCIFGQRRMCLLYWLVLMIFFFVLPFLVKLFLLYTSCVLRGALHFQWDWFYYLSKKNSQKYLLYHKHHKWEDANMSS